MEDKLELGVDEWFKEVQPAAIAQISERMLEAVRKGYWEASDETVQALVEKYLEIIENNDVYTPNEKFKTFLENKATGFGLDVSALQALNERQANPEVPESSASAEQSVKVEGVKLEKQPEQETEVEDDMMITWISLAVLGLLIMGFFYELLAHRKVLPST